MSAVVSADGSHRHEEDRGSNTAGLNGRILWTCSDSLASLECSYSDWQLLAKGYRISQPLPQYKLLNSRLKVGGWAWLKSAGMDSHFIDRLISWLEIALQIWINSLYRISILHCWKIKRSLAVCLENFQIFDMFFHNCKGFTWIDFDLY